MTVLPLSLYFAASAPYAFGVALGFKRARWFIKKGPFPFVWIAWAVFSVMLSNKIFEAYNVVLSVHGFIVWPGEYVVISFLLGLALGGRGQRGKTRFDRRL